MFYGAEILAKRGKLAAPWIAAHFDKRLTKQEVLQVSIEETVDDIQKGRVPELALRTSSHILLGLSKILFRKTKILYEECSVIVVHFGKRPHQASQIRRAEPRRIAYDVRLADFILNMEMGAAAGENRGEMPEISEEIEEARGSLRMQSYDQTFSLNDISLSTAVTFLRSSEALEGAEEGSDGMITHHISTAVEEGSIGSDVRESVMGGSVFDAGEDYLSQKENNGRKRKGPEKEHKKREKIDRKISFSAGEIKSVGVTASAQGEEIRRPGRPALEQPLAIKQMVLELEEIEKNGSYGISLDRSIEIPRGALEGALEEGVPLLHDVPRHSIDVSYIEESKEQGAEDAEMGAEAEEPAEMYPEMESLIEKTIEERKEVFEFSAQHSKREKAALFLSLLHAVTQGRVEAYQPEPYSDIRAVYA